MALLSPLDLLQIPDKEQDVIRCLVRQPQLTAQEIASRTQIPLHELKELLLLMVKKAQLHKTTKDNEDVFHVSIGGDEKKSKVNGNASKSLLDSLFG